MLKNLLKSKEFNIAAGIMISLLISFFIAFQAFQWKATKIAKQLNQYETIMEDHIVSLQDTTATAKNLVNQFDILKCQKKQYLETAQSFEVLFYTCNFILIIVSVITGILAILIARNGWEKASGGFKTTLLTVFFVSSITALVPKVFDHEKNLKDNLDKFFFCSKMQVEIYNGVCSDTCKSNSARQLRRYLIFQAVNKGIEENNNLFVSLDQSKLPAEFKLNEIIKK